MTGVMAVMTVMMVRMKRATNVVDDRSRISAVIWNHRKDGKPTAVTIIIILIRELENRVHRRDNQTTPERSTTVGRPPTLGIIDSRSISATA